MNPLVITDPKELVSAGYVAPRVQTLEDTPDYASWRRELDFWIQTLPGLRTPREEDGSGGTPPRPHQLRHAAIALQRPHSFWAHTMGTGKTCGAMLVILGRYGRRLFAGLRPYFSKPGVLDRWLRLRSPGEVGAFLLRECEVPPGSIHIVAPRHVLKHVWMKELERMNLAWAAEIITSEAQFHRSRHPIWIYDLNDFPKTQSAKGKAMRSQGRGLRLRSTAKGEAQVFFLGHSVAKVIAKRFPPGLLVVDEAHRLREGSERTRCMRIIRARAKHVLELTGTPMDGWVEHAATLLEFGYGCQTVAFPFTAAEFGKRFTKTDVVATDVATGRESADRKERVVPGVNPAQVPSFIRATRHLMHRLNLVDPEVKGHVKFPPEHVHRVLVPMDIEQQLFYRAVHKAEVEEIKRILASGDRSFRARANTLTLINKLRTASATPWLLGFEEAETALVREVETIVKAHAAEGRKALIGTTFVHESRFIYERLQAAGIDGVRIYRKDDEATPKSISKARQDEILERFIDDDDCMFLVSNKELVAEGLNLAETASVLVSTSRGWRANIEEQWKFRVIRPGQRWPHVDSYVLANVDTVDIYVDQLMNAKLAANAHLIDLDFSGDDDVGSLELDPFELARLLVGTQED